jgi:hypothetical protein
MREPKWEKYWRMRVVRADETMQAIEDLIYRNREREGRMKLPADPRPKNKKKK